MITDPLEDCPPDEEIFAITIHASRGVSQTHSDKTWSVHCPQWKFHGHSENLTQLVAVLVAEIESHNEECNGNPPIHKDFNAWAEKNGMATLRKEHWPKAPPSAQEQFKPRKNLKPIQDDGKKTQRVSQWQAPT